MTIIKKNNEYKEKKGKTKHYNYKLLLLFFSYLIVFLLIVFNIIIVFFKTMEEYIDA